MGRVEKMPEEFVTKDEPFHTEADREQIRQHQAAKENRRTPFLIQDFSLVCLR